MPKRMPEVNASSMADIAFLLLVFFLVTTEINADEGIGVKLPEWTETPPEPVKINDRNTLMVLLNSNNELLVEEERFDIEELRDYGKRFIDNYGLDEKMSESPDVAVISFKGDRGTSYETYITVYNELIGIYKELRNEETVRLTGRAEATYSELDKNSADSIIRNKVKNAYPILLSEAEPTDFSNK